MLVPLEVLNLSFMLLGRGSCGKSSQIAAFVGLGIDLSRIQAEFARFQFSNHFKVSLSQYTIAVL